jgi:hypothetical protein
MPYDREILRQTAIYGTFGAIGMVLMDVIFADVLGLSDAVIVVAMFLLLAGYFFLYVLRDYLSAV